MSLKDEMFWSGHNACQPQEAVFGHLTFYK